jgi:tRNA(Ile)-lysidine synthase
MALTRNRSIEHQFLSFINTEQLFSQTDCILLTVSGGLDSVVMAELFRTAGFQYSIAHVNFELRGAESDEDEAFVSALAERHGVRFHTARLPAKQQAEEQGVSTQMAARHLRYAWFEQLAEEFGYAGIATAHHQDDVLETILINLVRGTGLTGLRGIPIRQGRIIRPLWFADRETLGDYAQKKKLVWREDSSNVSDKYRRNRLRHQVIPILKEMNPSLLQTLQTTVARLQSADKLVDEEMLRSWEELAENRPEGVFLSIQQLLIQQEWAFRLSEWLKPYGFHYVQIDPITEAVRGDGFGQKFQSATHQVLRDRDHLVVSELQSALNKEVDLPEIPSGDVSIFNHFYLRFEIIETLDGFQIPLNPDVACLDADRISGPLTVRRWQTGDRFQPLGMNGRQSVGNFLTNQKVALTDRGATWVLLAGEAIAWLIGYRPDDRFRVTDQTRKILKIERRFVGQ